MWMRVAVCIHLGNLDKIKNTYDLMSQKYFTHATPTLFNAGTPRPQLSSCYLISMESDSIKGIYNTYLEAIGKYKLDDLKKIAIECNIDLKDNKGKNKNKSVLYDSINLYKLNE